MNKGFTNDAIPALSACESPIEGKFVQAFFDLMRVLGMSAESSQPEHAKISTAFSGSDGCTNDFLINCNVYLAIQWKLDEYRFDAMVTVQLDEEFGRVAVELDGSEFHSSHEQRMRDGAKTSLCLRRGIAIASFPGNYVYSHANECASSVLSYASSLVERISAESQRSFCRGLEYGEKMVRRAS